MKVQIEWIGPDRETKYGLMIKGDVILINKTNANNFCKNKLAKLFDKKKFKKELREALAKKSSKGGTK
jgi:hypothetical protein